MNQCPSDEQNLKINELLEKMNSIACDINRLELELLAKNRNFQVIEIEYKRRKDHLIASIGIDVIEKSTPYFVALWEELEARHACTESSESYAESVNDFEESKNSFALFDADKKDKLNIEPFEMNRMRELLCAIVSAQVKKDEREQLHARRAHELGVCQTRLRTIRDQVGRAIVARAMPWFNFLQEERTHLEQYERSKSTLKLNISKLKQTHSNTMKELEQISMRIRSNQ